jgi:hypothetical protein
MSNEEIERNDGNAYECCLRSGRECKQVVTLNESTCWIESGQNTLYFKIYTISFMHQTRGEAAKFIHRGMEAKTYSSENG